ncbi:MAG TPA: fumarate hydratase, partial [Sneathiellales bacterium]|nr:fumarate hydratase [Sneathiellales bacterium]
MSAFAYQPMFPQGLDETPYRKLTSDHVSTEKMDGQIVLKVEREALVRLTAEAFRDTSHLLRPGHLQQLANILDDTESSDNDRFVARELLKNANIAAGGILPMCQDTGTAIIMGKKGQFVWTEGSDASALSEGVVRTFTETNLRYSQMAPLNMYDEVNTGNNLPAQIDIYAT